MAVIQAEEGSISLSLHHLKHIIYSVSMVEEKKRPLGKHGLSSLHCSEVWVLYDHSTGIPNVMTSPSYIMTKNENERNQILMEISNLHLN
jgi:hypothetical protein